MATWTVAAGNPLDAAGGDGEGTMDVQAGPADELLRQALAGLLLRDDGAATDPESAVDVLEARLRAREAELEARLEARLSQLAPLEMAVRSAVGRITSAPPNWHQYTAFALASTDPLLRRRGPLVFGCAVAMVAVQCAATVSVFAGVVGPTCSTSDHCAQVTPGSYCARGGTCGYCGDTAPYPEYLQGTFEYGQAEMKHNSSWVLELCAHPRAQSGLNRVGAVEMFTAEDVRQFCDYCVHGPTGDVNPRTLGSLWQDNITAMTLLEWL